MIQKVNSLKHYLASFYVIALISIAGCGPSRPETAQVTGKVTIKGQQVPLGKITFFPEVGRPASGTIQPDGTFALTTFETGDGAVVGNHTVTIEAVEFVDPTKVQPKSFKEEIMGKSVSMQHAGHQSQPRWLVPARYANRQTSELSAQVQSGSNKIDFDLPEN